MICISSPAGRRLARAKAAKDAWSKHNNGGMSWEMIQDEYDEAADELTTELMKGNHHLTTEE